MGPFQRKATSVVGFQAILTRTEPIDQMAFGAIRLPGPHGKFIAVIILMALGTGVVRQRVQKAPARVAFPAVDLAVFSLQGIASQVVIEIVGRAGDPERAFIVAIGTLTAKLTVVNILMTSGTLRGLYADPVLE